MAYQTVFKRYELKYMITREQQARILSAMEPYMIPDKYGRSTIRNIYFDTDDHILARHSIARPDFKEKLRIRSYSRVSPEDTVFVELKRKFDHVVYKRRVSLPESLAMKWTTSHARIQQADDISMSQMSSEIEYFMTYYGELRPAAFLSYDRLAYKMRTGISVGVSNGGRDFRVTFDENILFRDYDLSLESDVYGTPLLEDGQVLMEIKCSGGIPLWMTKVLSEEHIYKTSYSKYGTAYMRYIQPQSMVHAAEDARTTVDAVSAPHTHSGSQNSRTHRRNAGYMYGKDKNSTAHGLLHYLGA